MGLLGELAGAAIGIAGGVLGGGTVQLAGELLGSRTLEQAGKIISDKSWELGNVAAKTIDDVSENVMNSVKYRNISSYSSDVEHEMKAKQIIDDFMSDD